MKVKILELRDEGTFIPVLCVDMQPDNQEQRYYLRRVGYPCDGEPNIVITKASADGDKASNDPYYWGDRAFKVAHNYIIENWVALRDGDVVDVSHILGEAKTKKLSERFTSPL